MLLEGEIAELFIILNLSIYRKYIWENKKNKPSLYVKPINGILQTAQLFSKL